jgi:hypothetical protein
MGRRPNYSQERADRNRRKEARRDERLAAKAARSKRVEAETTGAEVAPSTPTATSSPDEDVP